MIARKKTPLTDAIESLVSTPPTELIGYKDGIGIKLSPKEIHCILAEGDKICALTETEKLQLDGRLYQWEEQLPKRFIRINRSLLANLDQIHKLRYLFRCNLPKKFCMRKRSGFCFSTLHYYSNFGTHQIARLRLDSKASPHYNLSENNMF